MSTTGKILIGLGLFAGVAAGAGLIYYATRNGNGNGLGPEPEPEPDEPEPDEPTTVELVGVPQQPQIP